MNNYASENPQNQVMPSDGNNLYTNMKIYLDQCYLKEPTWELSQVNEVLRKKNKVLEKEAANLNLEIDKQNWEIKQLQYEVEELKEELNKTIDQSLYYGIYNFRKYKEFIKFLCQSLSLNLEIESVHIEDLQLIKDLDFVSNHVYKDMEFKLNFDKGEVVLSFEDDIQKYLDREEYIKSNPDRKITDDKLHLNLLINELKKIGDGRKVDNQYKLKINPIKSAIYMGRTVYSYVNEEFALENKKKIDEYIEYGVPRYQICEDVKHKKNIYNLLIKSTLKKNDLVIIPDMDVLCDKISDLLIAITEIFSKQADILLEEFLMEYEMYSKLNSIQLLGKIKSIIEAKEHKMQKFIAKENSGTRVCEDIEAVGKQESKSQEVGDKQEKNKQKTLVDVNELMNQ